MGVVVWGYRGGVGALRIPYKLSTLGGFRHKKLSIIIVSLYIICIIIYHIYDISLHVYVYSDRQDLCAMHVSLYIVYI
jgi:hypothetical protein